MASIFSISTGRSRPSKNLIANVDCHAPARVEMIAVVPTGVSASGAEQLIASSEIARSCDVREQA